MAAPTVQQFKKNYSASEVTSLNVSFEPAPATNALVVVFAYACDSTYAVDPGTITCSDNKGNTYTGRVTQQVNGNYLRNAVFTAPAATSGGTFTVTVGCTNAATWTVIIVEVRGYQSSPVIEHSGAAYGSIDSSSSPYSPLNFGASSNAELLYLASFGCLYGYSRSYSAGSGWTVVDQYDSQTDRPNVCVISKAVTSTGTYDPEWTIAASGGVGCNWAGISIIAGSEGLPSGNNDLAGGATAGATASASLSVQRNLASAAVAGALATGTLNTNKALTGAAIGQAVGAAALQVFSQVWRVPTNAANGTAVHALIFTGSAPTYTVLAQGNAVVAGGYVDVPGTGSAGTKAFAFVHNYNDNTATTSIRGGPSIATLTSI